MPRRFLQFVCRIVFALTLPLLATCAKKPVKPRGSHVILIVLDTLRADRLSCYGYPRLTSPNMDAFASGATLFERAVATAPYTLPSHASLFTGKLPMFHTAQAYLGAAGKTYLGHDLAHRPLMREHLTLAEAMRDAGYSTAAFAANIVYLIESFGLNQGFDLYRNGFMHGGKLNDEILPWMEENYDTPFFLFLNYMDTHEPYNTRAVKGFEDGLTDRDSKTLLEKVYPMVMSQSGAPKEELAELSAQYDLSIRNADQSVGEVLEKLKELGIFDDALIVITSDHGEFLGEHDYMGHWKDLYEEVIHVPLIIKLPGQTEPQRITERTSLVRVPGMILDTLNDPKLAAVRSQFIPEVDASTVIAESRYSHDKDYYHSKWGHRFQRVRTAIYEDPFKYIQSSDGGHELYDLSSDPKETTNRIGELPGVVARLESRLAEIQSRAPQPAIADKDNPTDLPKDDADEIRNLQDLGYLGR